MAKKGSNGGVVACVTALAEPIAAQCGVLVWDVRFIKEGADWILRVIIDREDGPISINDCVAVSRQLSPLLDEADPIEQSYCLEVTSPGADRELTRPEHFAIYEGLPVNVKLYRPDEDGQREIAGLLDGNDETGIHLTLEDGTERTFDQKSVAAVHAIDEFTLEEETL